MRYAFGSFEIRPDERRVLNAGEPVTLGARAFDLLLALIEHRDRVVGKDELMALVWPGMVVEENNLTVQVSALRKMLGVEAISTVPGRGYRFTLTPDERPAISPTATAASAAALELPEKPSIAVLPFANTSGDPEQEHFADGIAEDIITELARFHTLFVIARNSSFSFKGKTVDVRAVGEELGVRYVLEGSVRSSERRIRVSAQLVDATTRGQLWAERYDRLLEDVFAVQEEITRSIVAAIAPQVDAEEQARVRRLRPENLSAYDLALRARADAAEAYRKSDHDLWECALSGARKALERDPRSVIALEVVAMMQGRYLFMFMGDGSQAQARWEEAMSAATRLVELDPSGCSGHTWMAMLLSLANRGSEAFSCARRAHELNSNDVLALITLAYVDLMDGRAVQALERAEQATRLSPRDPQHYITDSMRAAACFFLRRHQEGLRYALLSVGAAPNWPVAHINYLMCAVGAGELAGARAAFATARRLAPQYIEHRLNSGTSAYNRPEDALRVRTALRIAAGLEDPNAAALLR
jgi:TolB-like protein